MVSTQYGAAGWVSGRQVVAMNEACDRCGPAVGAGYRAAGAGELYLCGHCAGRLWRALSAQGWIFWPLDVHAVAPQAGAAPGCGPAEAAA